MYMQCVYVTNICRLYYTTRPFFSTPVSFTPFDPTLLYLVFTKTPRLNKQFMLTLLYLDAVSLLTAIACLQIDVWDPQG